MYLGFFGTFRVRLEEVVGIFNPVRSIEGSTESDNNLVS
jgi:hypothetical protein